MPRHNERQQIKNLLQRNPVPPKSGIMPNFAAANKHEMKAPDTNCHIKIKDIGKDARTPELVAQLLDIWEASVRTSHHFLTENDIRSLLPQAEDAIRRIETLWVACDGDARIGFMGVQSGKIEMLFLRPDYFRKGIGSALIRKAFSELGARYVDVNEQNPAAVKFYERMGFRTFRRDSTDDQGNPFPILRMKRGGPDWK